MVKSRGLLQDRVISSSMITVPGVDAGFDGTCTHSLSPHINWYQFSRASPYAWDGEKALRRLHGGLMVGAEWGVENLSAGYEQTRIREGSSLLLRGRCIRVETGRLHGLRTSEMADAMVDTDHEKKPPEFATERDFFAMILNLQTIDLNDPRNANLLMLGDILLPSQKSKEMFRTDC